jgi:hypothetical protein
VTDEEAVRAERWRLARAIRGGASGLCACAGCPHLANCRCGCPECAAAYSARKAVAADRERIAAWLDARAQTAGGDAASELEYAAKCVREGVTP